MNSLGQSLLGVSVLPRAYRLLVYKPLVLPSYKPPAKYTSEDFGVVYLYEQSGGNLVSKDQDLDNLIDKGFEDFTEDESAPGTSVSSAPDSNDPNCGGALREGQQ